MIIEKRPLGSKIAWPCGLDLDNAIVWLQPHVRESGSLLAISRATNTRGKPSKDRTHRLIAEAAAKAGVTVPDNAGRHTFISMHVARKPCAPLSIPHMKMSTLVVLLASNRLVVGQNTNFLCLLYRRDPLLKTDRAM
jgi:hypothetical protein